MTDDKPQGFVQQFKQLKLYITILCMAVLLFK